MHVCVCLGRVAGTVAAGAAACCTAVCMAGHVCVAVAGRLLQTTPPACLSCPALPRPAL